ncbi:hypothetical protein DFH06DRAFT_274601 [Mycena polygramma]|nr:hypothetical protein DFH06DRAFT_274601 [Mycena polygramma]
MQFQFLALLSLCAVASAAVGRPQPSATPPSYSCPDTNTGSHAKVSELCDSPPHSGTLFGCTYRTGSGTGTHACTYNSKTGQCTTRDTRCPTTATVTSSHYKRNSYRSGL